MTIPFAEHQVQLAMRQFINPGDLVYDIGANEGWLTKPMSRLVGPAGHVICFEPSPRNLKGLRDNLREESIFNATVLDCAIFSETGRTLSLFENAFSNADSLYNGESGAPSALVKTLALDDFAEIERQVPCFIKADIEGAEYDMLVGAETLIEKARPKFLLETKSDDLRPFNFLRERGYATYDVIGLDRIEDADAIRLGRHVGDHLYLPEEADPAFYGRHRGDWTSQTVDLSGTVVGVDLPLTAGMNIVRLWGESSESPYETLVLRVFHEERTVVSLCDQLVLLFSPFLPFVVYAPANGTMSIRLERERTGFTLTRIETAVVPMLPGEHRRHEVLAVMRPFGLPD